MHNLPWWLYDWRNSYWCFHMMGFSMFSKFIFLFLFQNIEPIYIYIFALFGLSQMVGYIKVYIVARETFLLDSLFS